MPHCYTQYAITVLPSPGRGNIPIFTPVN